MIEARDFSVTYNGADTPTLKGINIDVSSGRFILVTGPTGSGKSTLLMGLGGILQHESSAVLKGQIRFEGTPIHDIPLKNLCQKVGWVFQNPAAQICTGTPEKEVVFGLENLGIAPKEMMRRIDEALFVVGLEEHRHKKTHTLSGGQQQRLVIAAALALRPKVLLLDEPLSQLDPCGASELIDMLQDLKARSNIAVVMVEHRLEGPLRIADELVVLNQGCIAAAGEPGALLKDLNALRALGIEPPPLPSLFEKMGRRERPFSAEAALDALHDTRGEGKSSLNLREACLAFGTLCSKRGVESPAPRCQSRREDPPLLRLENVCFQYGTDGRAIFENLSFSIYPGDRIALIGTNGVGKSTLLMLLAGALVPSAGKIIHQSKAALRCGLLMQNPDVMLIADSVEEELAFCPRQLGESHSEIVCSVIEKMSLSALAERAPFSLSRGERQRTAIGSVLTGKPELLLLDEPTTGQDRARIDRIMERIALECDAVVFSSHDLETSAKHANRVIVLAPGRIVADGTPDAVLSDWTVLQKASIRVPEIQQFLKAGALRPPQVHQAAVHP